MVAVWSTVITDLHLFLFLLSVALIRGQEEVVPENAVVGEPFVDCSADAIYVKMKTNSTFVGHVSVKFTPSRFCYQTLVTNNQIELLIPHGECAIARRRTFNPSGLHLEAIISVSFHPDFTTASDRLFHINCYHKKAKNGTEMRSPIAPEEEMELGPSCNYGIFESKGGPLAGMVALGQPVYHEWKCDHLQNECLFVTNCELIAGGTRHNVIDSSGCSKDPSLLAQLVYTNQSYVSQNVSVFGVSSISLVYFECQLQLLPKDSNGQCPLPNCSQDREKRHLEKDSLFEVRSQRIEISELERYENEELLSQATTCEAQPATSEEGICVSTSSVLVVACLFLLMSLVAVFLTSVVILRRYKNYNVASRA